MRNNSCIFGSHQSFRTNVNIEIIVECLLLLSSSYLFAAWHPGFIFLGDSGCSSVIRTHCVYDTYSLTFFKMDVCMNRAGFSFLFLSR